MHTHTYRFENCYFQYLSSCSAKLVEFQTFDFVMYKLVTIVITIYVFVVVVVVVVFTNYN